MIPFGWANQQDNTGKPSLKLEYAKDGPVTELYRDYTSLCPLDICEATGATRRVSHCPGPSDFQTLRMPVLCSAFINVRRAALDQRQTSQLGVYLLILLE